MLRIDEDREFLRRLQVAAPCHERWDEMSGGDRVRACERCQRKVYNLCEMTSAEAVRLLRETEGRLCVRFYRRADGTVMTRDCPVGRRTRRRRIARRVAAAGTALACWLGFQALQKPRHAQSRLVQALWNRLAPEPEVKHYQNLLTMGDIALSPVHDKPFLRGHEDLIEEAPRADPFVRLEKTIQSRR